MASKAMIQYEKCKRIGRDNTKCVSILLKCIDLDREDIIDQITEVIKVDSRYITPDGIVKMYEDNGEDINKFIAVYDKAMNNAAQIRKDFYNGYEKGMQDYLTG